MQRQKGERLIRVSGVLTVSLLVVMLGGLLRPEAAVQTVSFGAKTDFGTGSNPVSASALTASQFSQQGPEVSGDGCRGERSARPVRALSGDGNTGIVGGIVDWKDVVIAKEGNSRNPEASLLVHFLAGRAGNCCRVWVVRFRR